MYIYILYGQRNVEGAVLMEHNKHRLWQNLRGLSSSSPSSFCSGLFGIPTFGLTGATCEERSKLGYFQY